MWPVDCFKVVSSGPWPGPHWDGESALGWGGGRGGASVHTALVASQGYAMGEVLETHSWGLICQKVTLCFSAKPRTILYYPGVTQHPPPHPVHL